MGVAVNVVVRIFSDAINMDRRLKIAIVHDWLDAPGGAEQVLEQLILCHPQAHIYTLVDFLEASSRGVLQGKPVNTSFIQRLPWARKHFRKYLLLMPLAITRLDLSAYDLIVSSSWAFAKGIKATAGQCHVSYVHTPMRYVWDLEKAYLQQVDYNPVTRWLIRCGLASLRRWDRHTSDRGGTLIANSTFIAGRIKRCWRRSSTVINPPVAVDDFTPKRDKHDFYLTVSRLVHYKAVDKLVAAFRDMPDKKLVVIGDGPMKQKLVNDATPNIEFLGRQPRAVVADYMADSRAFVFSALEDFGIAPVEAQAAGTPVIAYGRGGVLDSVVPYGAANATGLFFADQQPASIIAAINKFESVENEFTAAACVANAQRFAPEIFRRRFCEVVDKCLAERTSG